MMPMYRCMDSHPEPRSQTFSFPQYPYPPCQPNPPMSYVPWPYGGNFGYPNPMPCHSCCNHSNVPGYQGFRPSYPQTPMPSPMHFPAPYQEAFPVQYVPPPHYSMELPQYDYDKKMPGGFHCCECPNHSHQNKGVKIEEKESPDVVEKVNDSVVPKQLSNYPYPVVWIPPEYLRAGEQRKLSGPEIVEQKKNPGVERNPLEFKSQEGDQRHGVLPLDMSNIRSLMQGGNEQRVKDQRAVDKKKEFPFPIFWMPSYDNKHDGAGKKEKDMDASHDQQTQEKKRQHPFPFFSFPLENKQQDVGMEEKNQENKNAEDNARIDSSKHWETSDNVGTTVNEDKSVGLGVLDGKGKDVNQKVIPVKQADPPKKEDNSEDTKGRGREVPVKHVDDSSAKKASGSSVERQSSSPKKSSKLPPVCLRVDPLPSKKKNGGGGSRSPSPPGHKKVQKETLTDTSKASASCSLPENSQQNQHSHHCTSNTGKEVEPSKEVADKGISENKDSMDRSQVPVDSKDASTTRTVGEAGKDASKSKYEDQGMVQSGDLATDNDEEIKKTQGSAKSVAEGSVFEKRILSDVAAAVLIQSAYRGFMVRRWEPLKKLKQIAEIREQVADIRNDIKSLEVSDLNGCDKQRVVIGETIMRLLLRLDTIQGLLSSLRDRRRSLARELVCLQEMLDDIMSKKSQEPSQEVSAVKPVDDPNANGNSSVCMSEQQEEEARKAYEELPAGDSENSHAAAKSCQGEVTHTIDCLPSAEVKEVAELPEHELETSSEDGQHELPGIGALDSKGLESGPTVDDVLGGQFTAGQEVVVDEKIASGSQLEQCGEAASPTEDKSDHIVTTSEVAIGSELPQVVVAELAASEPNYLKALEMGMDEVKEGGEVGLTMSADIPSHVATDDATEKEAEMHGFAALQPRTADEDSGAVSELKKNEVQITQETDVSNSGEEEMASPQQQEGTMECLMNVGGLVDEERTGDIVLDPDLELETQNESSMDDPLQADFQTAESQPLSLSVEANTLDMLDVDRPAEVIEGGDACLSKVADVDTPNENEAEKTREDYKDMQAVTIEDDTPMEGNKLESEDSENEQSEAHTVKEVVLIEKSEPSPASPITTEVSSGNASVSSDEAARKLIEENEKLREVMQKLMVAGKDQLQVISDLTGRVKDLEKKLAKKKKPRTRRCRAGTTRSSCVKTSSNHL